MVFSFSRVILLLFACGVAYYAYTVYLLFFPAQCPTNNRQKCLLPAYGSGKQLELWVYASPKQLIQPELMQLLWRKKDFQPSQTLSEEVQVQLPPSALSNGSLFAHVFISPKERSPLTHTHRPYMSAVVVPLTRYAVPKDTTFNLLSRERETTSKRKKEKRGGEEEEEEEEGTPVSHWVPWLDIHSVADGYQFDRTQVPAELMSTFKFFPGTPEYLPILYVDRLKITNRHLQLISPSNSSLPLLLSYSPVSVGQLRLWLGFSHSLRTLKALGFTEKEFDDIKGIFLDTNLWLLLVTVVISFSHLLFDFLAFKNDISFWRGRKSMAGLSTRTILWRCFSQLVVFLYLMEEKTSLLVLVPAGVASVIEFWKVTKALKVEVVWSGWFPRVRRREIERGEVESEGYDSQAMRYLSFLLYPLVLVGAVYQLLYASHKSWYSWVIHSLVNAVYAFGFLFMLPQLFLNYKLKSVAHLPWRAFMYKAFNTFIDDVFAFLIVMPTAHRIAVFRDDLIFLVYLYQRWLYPVDRSRVNEFGESYEQQKKQN